MGGVKIAYSHVSDVFLSHQTGILITHEWDLRQKGKEGVEPLQINTKFGYIDGKKTRLKDSVISFAASISFFYILLLFPMNKGTFDKDPIERNKILQIVPNWESKLFIF